MSYVRESHILSKVMTIRISRVLPLFNFERVDILCPQIGHPSEILRPFKFPESFRCSISSVSIYYIPESDIRVKCYDYSNFRELPLFNFERLDELCHRIGHLSEILWPLEFLESFRYSISSVLMSYVRESDILWKVKTIQISRVLPLFNFERLDILCPRIRHRSEMLWAFEFVESIRCSISSHSIYYVPESVFCVKSYDHSNFWTASVVQFRASRYNMSPNWTSVWNVKPIQISRELPLFNF